MAAQTTTIKADTSRASGLPFAREVGLLGRYLKRQRGRVVLLATLILAVVGLQLANPLVIRYFLDTAQAGGGENALLLAAGLFIAFSILQQGISVGADYLGENVSWSATNRLRADLTHHLLGMDLAFHKQHTPGELIARVDGDVTELGQFFSRLTLNVLANLLLILGVMVFLTREEVWIGAGMLVYVILALAAMGGLQKLGVRQWNTARTVEADFSGYLEERLDGTEDIRANGGEGYVLRNLLKIMRRQFVAQRRAQLIGRLTWILSRLLYVLGYALGLGLGAYLYLNGKASIGTAYLILYYITLLDEPLQAIRDQVNGLQRASASIQRVHEMLELSPASSTMPEESCSLSSGSLAIRFQDVSFAYQDGEVNGTHAPVLKAISFNIEPGRVVGVLGRTGSGKTTLTRLLARLYDPQAGVIELGGRDIQSVLPADVRQRVGMVTQDVQLFQASVRDNISFFDPHIPDEHILQVISDLGLQEWYRKLPAGLDTRLGGSGSGQSAGEAQLLALSRVFLEDPGLVILDEASSRLDLVTERLLDSAIRRLLKGRTGLIVAHRLATVQRVDDILILENGQIEEFGPRVALAGDPSSHFARLLKTGLEERLA